MTRTTTVLLACAALLACEQPERPTSAPRERSQAVQSQSGASAPVAAAPVPPTAAASAPLARPRELCAGQLDKPGRPLPKGQLEKATAAGATPVRGEPARAGRWTWLNFWAAWCKPCKEEIPRLRDWEQRLNAAGRSFDVQFVSLDDDPRQLQQFLDAEPESGLRATYWLREGKDRDAWLSGIGLSPDPELPVHVLVDPRGSVRCIVQGAVEDTDYPRVVGLLGG